MDKKGDFSMREAIILPVFLIAVLGLFAFSSAVSNSEIYNLTSFEQDPGSVNSSSGNYTGAFTIGQIAGDSNSSTYNSSIGVYHASAIDRHAPNITFGFRTENDLEILTGGGIYINMTFHDSNLKNITFNLYNSSGYSQSVNFNGYNFAYNFTDLSDGTYKYNVTVADYYDNLNRSTTR